MRHRATLLAAIIGIAVVAVACGRASESDINQALGITPTPTQSAADLATATARAAAAAATQQAAAEASGSPAAVAQGDITQGSTFYRITCAQCHRPNGTGPGPVLAAADSPILNYSVEQFDAFLRGESSPGGVTHTRAAYTTAELSDKRITDIYAYLLSESGQ